MDCAIDRRVSCQANCLPNVQSNDRFSCWANHDHDDPFEGVRDFYLDSCVEWGSDFLSGCVGVDGVERDSILRGRSYGRATDNQDSFRVGVALKCRYSKRVETGIN